MRGEGSPSACPVHKPEGPNWSPLHFLPQELPFAGPGTPFLSLLLPPRQPDVEVEGVFLVLALRLLQGWS